MAPVKDLYISLRDDPNLEIPEGESRESAAWAETAQRTRQHHTNAKALGMAAELKEDSAVEKFADFIKKAKNDSGVEVNDDGSLKLDKKPKDGIRIHDLGYFHPDEIDSDGKIKSELFGNERNDTVSVAAREGYRGKNVLSTGQIATLSEVTIPKGAKSYQPTFEVGDRDKEPGGSKSILEAPAKTEEPKAKGITAKSVGPFASKRAFNDAVGFSFRGSKSSAASVSKIVNGMSAKKRETLAHNVHEYFNSATDEGEHDLHDDMADWASSLPEEDTANLLNHLASSRKPFTANSSIDSADLKSNGYIDKASTKGGHKLTVQGAAHLISGNMKTSGKNPFMISEKKFAGNKKDISDPESWGEVAPDKFVPDKTTKEKQNQLAKDLTDDGIFENEKTANKVIAGTTDDDTNFVDHEEKLTAYHDELGGHPIQSSGSKGHIDNLNNDTTTPVRGHTPKGADVTTDTGDTTPEPEFKPIEIYDRGRFTGDDFSDGKLKPELFEGDGDFAAYPEHQKDHLKELTFKSGEDHKTSTTLDSAAPKPKATATKKPAEDPGERVGGREETKPVERKPTKESDLPASEQRIDTTRAELEAEEQAQKRIKRQADGKRLGIPTPTTDRAVKRDADAKAKKVAEAAEAAEAAAASGDDTKLPQTEANSIMDVLDDHHNTDNAGKTTDEGTAFNELKDKLAPKLLRGELDQDDIKDISEHLSKFPADTNVVSASGSVSNQQMTDVLRAGNVTPPPPSPDKPVGEGESGEQVGTTRIGEGIGNTGKPTVKPDDSNVDESTGRRDKIGDLIEHHSDGIKAAYEKEYGSVEDNTSEFDHSFDDYKAALIEDNSGSDKAVEKFKQTASKHTNTARKAAATKATQEGKAEDAAKNAEAATEKQEEKTKKSDAVTELHQKLRDAGHKASKAEASALYDSNDGDIDAAVGEKNEAAAAEKQKVEDANTLPEQVDSLDKIKEAAFGTSNPTGLLAGNLPERSANKHGVKGTQLARDLLIHAQTHGNSMSRETRKQITESLAVLAHPEEKISGFKANKGEKFADMQHAIAQVEDLQKRGIDINSPEAAKELQSKDLTLQEHRQNFSAKHLDSIKDATGDPIASTLRSQGKETSDTKRIWDHGTPNLTETFNEDGTSKGRSKFDHTKGEAVSEKTETGESTGAADHKEFQDTIHHSPVKEHHGTLTAKQEESMSKLRQAHKDNAEFNDEGAKADIDEHSKALEDSGLSRSDFEHDEDDIPTTGPPDKEVAIYMQGQGYEWHEDTRRWRHKETDDNYRKSNGATKGTFASGSHSETGAHGYMATAEVGADGKVSATPDSSNFAVTPAGTHGVSSDLGGSPPTSAQGVQGHVLGHALNNAGVSHDGKSKSFPMSHLNGTGIQGSKHHDAPSSIGSKAKRAASGAYRAATGGGAQAFGARTAKNWSSPLVSESSPLSQTLGRAGKIGVSLVRDVFGKSDISELTPVELLQYHVALQKAEKTKLRV